MYIEEELVIDGRPAFWLRVCGTPRLYAWSRDVDAYLDRTPLPTSDGPDGSFPTEALGYEFGRPFITAMAACRHADGVWHEPAGGREGLCSIVPASIGWSGISVVTPCADGSICTIEATLDVRLAVDILAAWSDLSAALEARYGPANAVSSA